MLGSGRQQAAAPDQSPRPGMEATDFQGRGACPTCSEGAVLRSVFRLQRGLPFPKTLVLPARARFPGGTAHSDSVGSAQGHRLLTRALSHSVGWVGFCPQEHPAETPLIPVSCAGCLSACQTW